MLPSALFITVFGLPFHPLIVHATTVVVPAAAAAVLLTAIWPRFRAWITWGGVALAAAALILDPLSTASGEALQHELPRSALIRQHAELADALLPWLVGLLICAIALYALRWPRVTSRWTPPDALFPVVTVVSVLVAIGSLVWVVLVGHAGAAAAWHSVS